MKKILFLSVGLLFIAKTLMAQNYPPAAIVAAEYFIDTDPGVGNGTPIILTQEGINTFTIQTPSNLSIGMHLLAIRIKNTANVWSLYQNHHFNVVDSLPVSNPIVAAEYFFDTDPGLGNGTAMVVQSSGAVNQNLTIPGNLSVGTHLLVIRVKDDSNRWSLQQVQEIAVEEAPCVPTPTVSIVINNPICEGMPLHLNAIIEEAGIVSHSWSGPNAFSSTLKKPSIGNTTATNSGIYTFTVTNTEGCTATSTVEVSINPQNQSLCNNNMRALSLSTGYISKGLTDTGGTIFVIGDKVLMTARHVIDNFETNEFTLRLNGVISTVGFTKISATDNSDWSIIHLTGANADLFSYFPLAIANTTPPSNSQVSTYGGKNIVYDEGLLIGKSNGIIFSDLIACLPGQSGSPMMSVDGKIVGVLSFSAGNDCGWVDITRYLAQVSAILDQFLNENTSAVGNYFSITSGNWEDASTWAVYDGMDYELASTPPSPGVRKVTIQSNHIVSINSPQTIKNLYVEEQATLIQNANLTFSVPNINIKIDGAYKLNNGTLSGEVNLLVAKRFEWQAGTLNTHVTLGELGEGSKLTTNSGSIAGGAKLTNKGNFDWLDGNIDLNNATLENTATGTLKVSGNNSMVGSSGTNVFINSGKLIKNNSLGTTTIEVPFDGNNSGFIKGIGGINFTGTYNHAKNLAPGNQIGVLTLNTTVPLLNSDSNLLIDIKDGTGIGTGNDQLTLNTSLTLAGKLTVREATYVPLGTYTIISLTSGSISGNFDDVDLPPGYSIVVNQTNIQVIKQSQSKLPGSGNALTLGTGAGTFTAPDNENFNFDTNQNFTIDFWLRMPSNAQSPGLNTILRKGNIGSGIPFLIVLNSNEGTIELHRSDGSDFSSVSVSSIILADNKFHHFSFIKAETQLRIYIDGIVRGTGNDNLTGSTQTTQNLTMGIGDSSNGLGIFNGEIDELRIWNIILDTYPQDKLRERICRKITPTDSLFENLVTYYNFDETAGTTIYDHSITGNSATLSNISARTTSAAPIGDESTYNYVRITPSSPTLPSLTLGINNQDNLTINIDETGGYVFPGIRNNVNDGGTHIYVVNQKPNTENGIHDVGNNDRYFGVFPVNFVSPQYTATYNYNGNLFVTTNNESKLALYKRADNAAQTWESTPADIDINTNTLTTVGVQNTEYMLGLVDECQSSAPLAIIADTLVCAGNTLNLSFTGGNQTTSDTYSWAGPNSFSANSVSPAIPNVNTSQSGIYQLLLVNGLGCNYTASINITITEAAPSTISTNSPICIANTLNLSSSEAMSYTWVGPDNFTSALQNPTIQNVTHLQAGVYTLTITNENGCSATNTTQIIINSASVTITSNSPVCEGANLNLSSSGGVSYSWTGPHNFTSTLQNPIITNIAYSSSVAVPYIVTATHANGCTATNSLTAIVKQKPVLVITNPPPVAPPNTININDAQWYVGSTLVQNRSFYTNAACTIGLSGGTIIAQSGTYYVKAIEAGCIDIKPIVVKISNCNNTPITLNSPNNDIVSQTAIHRSTEIITANNKISGVSNITYRSAKAILLTPDNGGFSIANGVVFSVEIGGCQ